jgi:hypothetical protein
MTARQMAEELTKAKRLIRGGNIREGMRMMDSVIQSLLRHEEWEPANACVSLGSLLSSRSVPTSRDER